MNNWTREEYEERMRRVESLLSSGTVTMTVDQLRRLYALAPESHDGSGGSFESHLSEVLYGGGFP